MFSILLLIKILVHCVEFHRNRIPNQLFAKTNYIRINRIPVGGGVVMIDKSRAAIKENCKVLVLGVVNVSVSTLAAIVLICLYINSNFVLRQQSTNQGL
jgi:selenocysteine lyase/cysteine desulfurase